MSLADYEQALAGLALPAHLAIVMDGNGRWARQRGLPRLAGHLEGRRATKRIVQACNDLGLQALSLYTFSTENWTRPQDEVSGLMELIEQALREELRELCENNVTLRVSGRLAELSPSMQEIFREAIAATADNTGMVLNLCINYGGRAELVDAARQLVADVQGGRLRVDEIDEAQLRARLYAPELPDVELLLRPGGEMRISNYLLWEIAYAEMVVLDVLWPDFTVEHLLEGIRQFNRRERRFGGVRENTEK